ncbi:NAD(P)-dependent oxidoreductase [Dongia sp.]|uniref:precorrin-2 dehydrogenase/sirohydrochlorin ferrochelatase family protein n=1 Tax=Dongia sp. TaxID=1977262 RepID=UPI0035B0028C
MQAFPIFMRLENRRVLVVGAGAAAEAKRRLLQAAGAVVTLVAWADFSADRVGENVLVIGATGEADADAAISAVARSAGVPVNVVDRPDLSDFIMPAIVDRGDIVVAISTNGASPVLAQRVRAAVEAALPHGIEKLVRFAARFRSAVHARIADHDGRRHFWAGFFEGPIAKALLAGRERDAAREVIRAINGDMRREPARFVELVIDATDPDLLTLGALRALQQADLVLFDQSVASEIVDLARRDAERAPWIGQEIPTDRHVVRLRAQRPAAFAKVSQ